MPLHWTYSFRMGALSSGPSSAIFTHSEWRPRVRVTCPAARALRTQFTAPKGADGLSGDMARGVALAEQSLAIVRDLGDLRSTAEALSNLALQAMNAGAYARAEALNGEALSLFAPWVTAGTWPSDSGRWASSRHPSATMRAPPRPWKRAWRCDASGGMRRAPPSRKRPWASSRSTSAIWLGHGLCWRKPWRRTAGATTAGARRWCRPCWDTWSWSRAPLDAPGSCSGRARRDCRPSEIG